MWIIAGLGNPGSKYENTRHNVGFRVIDRLSGEYGISLEEKDAYCIGKGDIEGEPAVLVKPLTFMNRSGIAIARVMRKFSCSPGSLIVAHDELDLDAGVVKIKKTGSSGGHNGIQSVIESIGTRDFLRVRVGIGRERDIPSDVYVLSGFRPAEKSIVSDAIIHAADAIAAIVGMGIDKTMTKYNRSVRQQGLSGS